MLFRQTGTDDSQYTCSPSSNNQAAGNKSLEDLQRQSFVDCPTVGSTTMDTGSLSLVSSSSISVRDGASGNSDGPSHKMLASTRGEFLHAVLQTLQLQNLVKEHHPSTIIHQSGWLKFQKLIRDTRPTSISQNIFIQFASYLFYSLSLLPPTSSCHIAVITDPLRYTFGIQK